MILEISIPLPIQSEYDYLAGSLADQIQIGQRVYVPFGGRKVVGFVVSIKTLSSFENLKTVQSILDETPILTSEQLLFANWISAYYQSSLGEVLQAFFPSNLIAKETELVKLEIPPENDLLWDHSLLKWFKNQSVWEKKKLQKNYSGTVPFQQILNQLLTEGVLSKAIKVKETHQRKVKTDFWKVADENLLKETVFRSPNQKAFQNYLIENLDLMKIGLEKSVVELESKVPKTACSKFLELGILEVYKKEILHYDIPQNEVLKPITFTQEQLNAWNSIKSKIQVGGFQPMLLYGITGSGKTFLYIEALKEILAQGKSGIILVPEIALTPQTLGRFQQHFGEKIGVIHSKKSDSERYLTWKKILSGEIRIVIGPRSALFSPIQNLGIIIVDEEHESSYKQFEPSPRYHAKDSAIYRAFQNKCPIILGSATPSFETFSQAKSGKYHLIELKNRADDAKLPDVKIIDIREEKKQSYYDSPISPVLFSAIKERLEKNEGVILLQNRRGFSNYVECENCDWVDECPNCSVTLTFHKFSREMRCHYCGYSSRPYEGCPKCHSHLLKQIGVGTQQLEGLLKEQLPDVNILRMDQDSISSKTAHSKILKSFKNNPRSILLGTQMIAKGLDFHHVTLVGVIGADTSLLMQDFRSEERTYQLLSQVAGRSGRGKLAGEVMIQTNHSEHPIFQYVVKHDFEGFYNSVISDRQELNYPPFSRVILIEVKSKDDKDSKQKIKEIYQKLLTQFPANKMKGPVDPMVNKVGGWYRQHIFIFMPKEIPIAQKYHSFFMLLQKTARESWKNTARLIVDVDSF